MYTEESFCNVILKTTYTKALDAIQEKHYKDFTIPKKNGYRTIYYLDSTSSLALLQKNLTKNLLAKQPLPICIKGFQKGENYNTFLQPHIGAKFFLRIDIKNFFPSLTKQVVKDSLLELVGKSIISGVSKIVDLLYEIVTLHEKIPQGAYSSPALSNLIMSTLDQRITKYCQVFNIRYTRYADDLLFSSYSFDFYNMKWFTKKIKYILSTKKLKLNYSKLKYAKTTLVLNGYVISNQGIHLSRNRLYDIRHITTFVNNNYTPEKVALFIKEINKINLKHRNLELYPFKSLFQISQYLCGYRAFLISMLDDDFADTKHQKNMRKLIHKIEKQILRINT